MNKDCIILRQRGTYLFDCKTRSLGCTVSIACCSRLYGSGSPRSALSGRAMTGSGCAPAGHSRLGYTTRWFERSTGLAMGLTLLGCKVRSDASFLLTRVGFLGSYCLFEARRSGLRMVGFRAEIGRRRSRCWLSWASLGWQLVKIGCSSLGLDQRLCSCLR